MGERTVKSGVNSEMLGIFGLLWEALKNTYRNKKVVFRITTQASGVLVGMALFCYFLVLPKIASVSLDENRGAQFRILAGLYLAFCAPFMVLALVVVTALEYWTATTLSGKPCTLEERILRSSKAWTRAHHTLFWMTLLHVPCFLAAIVLCWLVLFYADVLSLTIPISISSLAMLIHLYLASMWMLGLVITITEEECFGVMALRKAGKLFRERKLHGFALMVLFTLLSLVVLAVFGFMICGMKYNTVAWYVFVLSITLPICPMEVFVFEAYTVFYHDWEKNQGEGLEAYEEKDVVLKIEAEQKKLGERWNIASII